MQKDYVIEFELNLEANLKKLKYELEDFTYHPRPLNEFIIKDPKTRRINASNFRDRIVHHAICNIITPIFEKSFIHDSFANQKNKGTHKAIKRAAQFIRKFIVHRANDEINKNLRTKCIGYAFKADIQHYFDTVDHGVLLEILKEKIKDPDTIWLIKLILSNHKTGIKGKGMPLGNLTSQFFANVYLHKLDQYIKHKLKVKYYIRYVDDFVIFNRDKVVLENWQRKIDQFLTDNLKIGMHPEKSRIIPLNSGITILGFRIFPDNIILKKSNSRRIWKRVGSFKEEYNNRKISSTEFVNRIEGWFAYAQFANTYHLRKKIYLRAKEIFLHKWLG